MRTSLRMGGGGQGLGQDAPPQWLSDAPSVAGRLSAQPHGAEANRELQEAWHDRSWGEPWPTGQMLDDEPTEPVLARSLNAPQWIDDDAAATNGAAVTTRMRSEPKVAPGSAERPPAPVSTIDGPQHRAWLQAASQHAPSTPADAERRWLNQSNLLGGYVRAFMSMRRPGIE